MLELTDKEKKNALNEVRILASIKHENVVAYKEAFFDEGSESLCIVMEFCDGGDLYKNIIALKKNKTFYSEDDVWSLFISMLKGLHALH